jgi:hypothetical protein
MTAPRVPQRLHGYIRLYCEDPACAGREIDIHVKDHGDEKPIRRSALRCPLCGTDRVSVHQVLDMEAWIARKERDARWSVNAQMWERDHPEMNGAFFLPFPYDQLPPTPAGWWDR